MPKFIDLTGKTFGRLTVVECVGRDKWGKALWLCKCSCGGETKTLNWSLVSGRTQSCGCFAQQRRREYKTIHGMCFTREYITWEHMIQRCENPNSEFYSDYGGRGIKVCKRWRESFKSFFDDMGPKPSPKHSIERIDVERNYESGNCCWTTASIQSHNRRPKSNTGHRNIGLSKNKKGYIWKISRNGKELHGTTKTLQEAIVARDNAERELYPELCVRYLTKVV